MTTNSPTRTRLATGSLITGLALLVFGAGSPAHAGVPAGNNGTIKVDGVDFDTHPDNQPHPGCSFQIDFYGFDADTAVTMVFEAQPPTGDAVLVTEHGALDGDDNSGGGSEEGLDGQFTVDLTDALSSYHPQDQQGFHVKLSITADDGDETGAQTKHKTYWVEGCDTGGTDGTDTGGVAPTTGEADTTGGVAPAGAEVEGAVITAPVAELPRTGSTDRSLFLIGMAFLVVGATALVAKRRMLLRS
jgi:LPXTG-motif cell wall-anchored protein